MDREQLSPIVKERGKEPAPERGRHTSWHKFMKSHLGAIAGADFFTVEALLGFGLVRYWVMFVIDVGTRRVHIAGITELPSEAWMKQIAKGLIDCVDGCLQQTRYLILDREPLNTQAFRTMLKDAGVEIVRLSSRSPKLQPPRWKVLEDCPERVPESVRHLW